MIRPYLKYLFWIALMIYIPIETNQHQDFDIFLLASADLFDGGNIYQNAYESGFHFFYGVIFAIILKPFTLLPVYYSRITWLCLNVLALYRCWLLLLKWFDFRSLSENRFFLFSLLSFGFSAKLILDNFHNGQVTIMMLWMMLEGFLLIKSEKVFFGTLLIALGISIKLLPLVMLPYLLYNGKFKATAYLVICWLAFLLLPSLFIGWERNMQLLNDWLVTINPSSSRHMIDTDETTLNGLSTLLPTLLMEKVPDIHALQLKRNILNLPVERVMQIITITRLIFISLFLLFLRRMPFKSPLTKTDEFLELSFLFLLIPLIFPHQQHYAFFFMFPAGMFVIYLLITKPLPFVSQSFSGMVIIMSMIFLLCNLHLLLGEFREYYDHFKIITYGALLMVGLLIWLRMKLSREIRTDSAFE